MAKHTITIEDLPDGGVWIGCDPSLNDVIELCKTPHLMTSADGYAAEVHIALRRAADIALAELPVNSHRKN